MPRTRLVLTPLLLLAACGRAAPGGDDDTTGVDAAAPDAPSGPDGTVPEASKVYAHSGTMLYRVDSMDLDVVEVGPFGAALNTASMTDIAVDKNGRMIGVTLSKIFEIDPDTGTATYKADFQGTGNLTSLCFVPVDEADPDSAERLITAGDQGDVYEINPDTGETTLLGNYGMDGANQIVSSGDIVSVRGFGTFATVNVGASLTDPDFLAQIDTTTWAATPIGTASTGHDRIFGIGFWGGTIFGFVDTMTGGEIVTISPEDGTSTPATNQTFRWYGAGVTTTAPIVN